MGVLLGGGISLVWLAAFLVTFWMPYNDPYGDDPPDWWIFWNFVWLVIPLAGYLAATLVTILRSTRRVGQGMLIGLTVTLPFAVAIVFGVAVSNSP